MDQAKEGQRPADRRERRRLHQFPVNYHHRDRSQDDAGQRRAMAQYLEPLIEHAVVGENIHADLACIRACGSQRIVDLRRSPGRDRRDDRSEEHTSELQSLMRISYAVFCLKKKKNRSDNKEKKRNEISTDIKQSYIHIMHEIEPKI